MSGKNYIGEMPGLGVLDDEQIAAVLTYLRREWGHTAPPIDPGQTTTLTIDGVVDQIVRQIKEKGLSI